jgi:hypothetical protein
MCVHIDRGQEAGLLWVCVYPAKRQQILLHHGHQVFFLMLHFNLVCITSLLRNDQRDDIYAVVLRYSSAQQSARLYVAPRVTLQRNSTIKNAKKGQGNSVNFHDHQLLCWTSMTLSLSRFAAITFLLFYLFIEVAC